MDPFVAEIRVFPFNFPPKGWAHCDGSILPLSQNTALFSLLGTTYGGDGKSTFALPDLQGRAGLGAGQGPGLSDYAHGSTTGSESVTLLPHEMPSHAHAAKASNEIAELQGPAPDRALASSTGGSAYQTDASSANVAMSPHSLAPAGGDTPHNNMPPTLVLNFCIALQGVFPMRW